MMVDGRRHRPAVGPLTMCVTVDGLMVGDKESTGCPAQCSRVYVSPSAKRKREYGKRGFGVVLMLIYFLSLLLSDVPMRRWIFEIRDRSATSS